MFLRQLCLQCCLYSCSLASPAGFPEFSAEALALPYLRQWEEKGEPDAKCHLGRSVPHGRAHLRGQSNETLSPESFSIRFSAHHLTLVAVLAASGNSTSNPCSAMLELMIWIWLWWQQGLCEDVAVSRGYILNCWSCSSLVFTEQAPVKSRGTPEYG